MNSTGLDRKSTRLNSSHLVISYAVFCLKKKKIWRCQLPRTGRRGRGRSLGSRELGQQSWPKSDAGSDHPRPHWTRSPLPVCYAVGDRSSAQTAIFNTDGQTLFLVDLSGGSRRRTGRFLSENAYGSFGNRLPSEGKVGALRDLGRASNPRFSVPGRQRERRCLRLWREEVRRQKGPRQYFGKLVRSA